jgi:PAS domain S-box-containing protein
MTIDTKELKTITALYVEDDALIREQTKKLFSNILKEVFVAEDGEEGLALYKEHKESIDVVVTDINMPKLNGLEMVEEINKITKSIPVIVTTAHTDTKFLMNAININVDKYIAKPFQVKDLAVTLIEMVVKYRRINNIEVLAKNLVHKSSKTENLNTSLTHQLEKLEKQNEYNKVIIDSFIIKLTIDKNGTVLEASDKFLRFFEYTKDEVIGKDLTTLRCETCDQGSLQKLMLKVIHTKKTHTATYTFRKKDEQSVDCDLTLSPFYNEEQLIDGYVIYLDIL